MDKKPHIKPYVYAMLAGFGAISLSVMFFFVLYRFDSISRGVSMLVGVLMPFVYGAVIAYLLKPVCNTVEAFLKRFIPEKYGGLISALAIAASMLFGLFIVWALVMMIVPQLIESITTLYYTAQRNIGTFIDWASTHQIFTDSETNEKIMAYLESAYDTLFSNVDGWVKNTLMPSMQNIVSTLGLGVINALGTAMDLLVGVIAAIYMLASRKRFARQAKLLLYSVIKPRWAQMILNEVAYADKMFGGFINGKILDSAIIGVLCYVVCIIVKFPSALLVSCIVGVTNVIPFFGPFIGAVPSALLILIQDPIKALWFVLFIFILQQLDGNVIGPKILGDTTGLSSFWVLFSILLFGGLWGFVGMIIGVPLFAVIYDVVKKLMLHGLRHNGQAEMYDAYHDEFGESNEPPASRHAH